MWLWNNSHANFVKQSCTANHAGTHTASRSTQSLNEWFSTRVFVVYFCIDRVAPLYHIYCVRWKLTISSILSLNWLKEEVAYWLNYTYVLHTRFTVSAADMNECSMRTDVVAIHSRKINRSINSARYRNGNFSFLVLTLLLSRVLCSSHVYSPLALWAVAVGQNQNQYIELNVERWVHAMTDGNLWLTKYIQNFNFYSSNSCIYLNDNKLVYVERIPAYAQCACVCPSG